MSEKITSFLFYMGLIAAVLAVLLTGAAFYEPFEAQIEDSLRTEAALIARGYHSIQEPEELEDFLVGERRITLISSDGTVLYESSQNAGQMPNHADRPEVRQALSQGWGQSVRSSDTFGTEDYYYALLLEDGNVLRVSATVESLFLVFTNSYGVLLLILLALLVLSVVFALLITRRLVRPIQKIPSMLDDPDLAEDPKRVYPELVPFVKEIQERRREQAAMRREFTANVSHELKTPLTTISGYAEMISTGIAKPEDVPRFAEKVQTEANRMLDLVNDIIELSRLDKHTDPKDWLPVDLRQIAEECADQLAHAAKRKHVTITVTGAPSSIVSGEEKKLWELIYNLVDNAIRYNREGGRVTIHVGASHITVTDNGIGIPREHQERIFERFYRVDKSHSRASGGTGLGLSIVKHIAEQHKAKITLESDPGLGTAISVWFPPADKPAASPK